MRVGERLRELREAKRLGRSVVAQRSGLSLRFLADVESGRGNIALTRLRDLALALETSIPEILAPPETKTVANPGKCVVALVGLRGAGKSTIGARVAASLDQPFFEQDSLITQAAGMGLSDLFAIHGDGYYRRLIRETLDRFLGSTHVPTIFATSGGLVLDSECFESLRRGARTVWLKASADDHWNRVIAQGDRRPMSDRPAAREELIRLLRQREPLYAQSDHVIDTSAAGLDGSLRDLLALASRS